MKKLISIFIATLLVFALCSCGKENSASMPAQTTSDETTTCVHSYIQVNSVEATCTEKGNLTFECSACGSSYTEELPLKDHIIVLDPEIPSTCTTPGLSEGSHCGSCNTILVQQNELPVLSHTYSETSRVEATKTESGRISYLCTVCGNSYDESIPATGSTGLEFSINSDGKTCAVVGLGTCEDSMIYIPEYFEGYTVTTIDANAFYECLSITGVSIPESIVCVGEYAFYKCSNLVNVTLPKGMTQIGRAAFLGCTSLTSITIPDSVTSVGGSAFAHCTELTTIALSSNMTRISDDMFRECDGLVSVVIPAGITEIGDGAFYECFNLNNITIPKSITNIGDAAFRGCRLKEVFYDGTTVQWEAIPKGASWRSYNIETTIFCTDGEIVI